MEYREFNDYELLSFIGEKNEAASDILFKKYEPLITSIASRFSNCCGSLGLDINDLIQEGRIALNNAILNYREDKDGTFYTFARVCIERRLISTIIKAKRQKHKILNESLSIESDIDGTNINLENIIGDYSNIPEKTMIDDEFINEIMDFAKKNLTDFEYQVFELRIDGFEYKEIALILNKDIKSIDNAIQRMKCKFKNKLKKKEE